MNLNEPNRAKDELARALGSGQPEAVARAAMSNVWPLFNAHFDMLTASIVALPSSVLDRYPVLRVVHPMTAVLARTGRSFKPVVYSDDARTLSPEELDFVTLAQMVAFRFSGDIPAALGYARRLEDRMLQTRLEARDRMDGPLWYFHHQIGSTLLAAGDTSRALLEFATARQLGRFSMQSDAERLALGRAALAHAVRGTLGDAQRSLTEARNMPEPTPAHRSASQATERVAAALIGVDHLDEDLDERLMELEPFDSIELSWPFALLARCRAYLARQQPEEALEAIHLATDAHAVGEGSAAADIVAATTIKALVATGDIASAWRVVEENPKPAVLTRLATVRLALHDGRFDAAAHDIRLLAADQSLGPAQRAESVLYSGWLELGRSGEVGRDTARQILRIAQRRDSRRLLAIMPKQLVDRVRDSLREDSGAEFEAITSGLVTFEMHSRPALTAGELRILNALPSRRSTAEMAAAFHVSPNTIKSQLRSLYRKLGCSTRDDAIRIATRLHLLVADGST